VESVTYTSPNATVPVFPMAPVAHCSILLQTLGPSLHVETLPPSRVIPEIETISSRGLLAQAGAGDDSMLGLIFGAAERKIENDQRVEQILTRAQKASRENSQRPQQAQNEIKLNVKGPN